VRIRCIRYATGVWKWEVVVEYQSLFSTLMSIILPFWKPKKSEMTFLGKRHGLWYKAPEVTKVDQWTSEYLDQAVDSWMQGRIPNCTKDIPRTQASSSDGL